MGEADRRPLASRDTGWARRTSAWLVGIGATANAISVLSMVFAAVGSALLAWHSDGVGLVLCAICVQLRLLCNLMDGMVAIEGGRQTPLGAIYNEVPDRVADSLFLVALGHAAGEPWLGWLAALAAALTAYIRVLGASLGLVQDFRGPMAKPQRMAVLTVACLLAAVEWPIWGSRYALLVAVWMIALGALLTCVTRLLAMGGALDRRNDDAAGG